MRTDISCGFPGFSKAVAHSADESLYPTLWKGLVAAYCPQIAYTRTTLFDLTSYNNHAVVVPLNSSTVHRAYNKGGKVINFPTGSTNSVSITNKAQISNINNSHTVALWMTPSAFGSSPTYPVGVIDKANNRSSTSYRSEFCILFDSTGHIQTSPGYGLGQLVSNEILVLGQRYFIAVTNDGTTTSLYINGKLDNSTTGLSYTAYTSALVSTPIGEGGYAGLNFYGQIGTTLIYKRPLNDIEIQSLYINSDNAFVKVTARRFEGLKPPTIQIIQSDTKILRVEIKELLSDCTIVPFVSVSINSDADIYGTTIQNIFSSTDIFVTQIQPILSDTDILSTTIRNTLSNTLVVLTRNKTILSSADIFRTQTQIKTSDADIQVTQTKTALSNTAIFGTVVRTTMSDAIIFCPLDLICSVSFIKNSQKDLWIESEVIQVTPSVPFNVTIANVGCGDAVRIEWEGTSIFYNVYMVETGPVYTKMNSYLISDHFYVVGGLQEGVEYTFIVRGADGQG